MSVGDNYRGSQIFSGLAQYIGLSTDQLNFIISQLVALGLATLYRTALHPSKTATAVRHAFGLVAGLIIGYFCFGFQAIHLAGLPAICYVIIITQNPHVMHGMVLTVALTYLSCLHLHRQFYDYGSYGLDISGPLMVITQKVTSLAFSLHDGLSKKEEDLTKLQKEHVIYKMPSSLEYFSYMLMFPSIMAGPIIFYKDYIEFIQGNAYNIPQNNSVNDNTVTYEPSPARAVVEKVIIALFCALVFVNFLPRYPISRIKDDHFVDGTSVSYKFWYLTVCTTLVRCKYYFAWTIADAVCNNCGIGLSKYKSDGSEEWNKLSNVDIFRFEFAASLKEAIEAWNKGTNIWLRLIVYDRTKKYSTLLTYSLSAMWHGFYAGYYLTFFSAALFTLAARVVRRHIRNNFTGTNESKLLYDILTFAVTHLVLAYITFPFVLLDFWSSVRLYNKMIWCLHVFAALALILVPKFVPQSQPREVNSKSSLALALRQAGPYTNSVGHND
ncbi:hypothetical protein NQ317_015628 [Molorchus minor]|uniref:Uncharacterized protein n=1 Tax=Molorchus minor TaxID=1323400 RepID=A0ABQ9JT00_9CUCU|nr:hypothetical protein NQ317_015628 [Molorchus minor]